MSREEITEETFASPEAANSQVQQQLQAQKEPSAGRVEITEATFGDVPADAPPPQEEGMLASILKPQEILGGLPIDIGGVARAVMMIPNLSAELGSILSGSPLQEGSIPGGRTGAYILGQGEAPIEENYQELVDTGFAAENPNLSAGLATAQVFAGLPTAASLTGVTIDGVKMAKGYIVGTAGIANDIRRTLAAKGAPVAEITKSVRQAIADPQYYFRFKADNATDPIERAFFKDADNWRVDARRAEIAAENTIHNVERTVGLAKLNRVEQAEFMQLMKATDETPIDKAARLTEFPDGISEKTINAYNKFFDSRLYMGKMINTVRTASGKHPIQFVDGIVPHRWSGKHRIYSLNEEGKDLVVKAFKTENEAKAAVDAATLEGRTSGILALPSEEGTQAISALAKLEKEVRKNLKKMKNPAKAEELIKEIVNDAKLNQSLARADAILPTSKVAKMLQFRKGAKGYTNLDDFNDFVGAANADISSIVKSTTHHNVMREGEALVSRMGRELNMPDHVAARVVSDMMSRLHGGMHAHPATVAIKSGLFHSFLGTFAGNLAVPAMNIGSAAVMGLGTALHNAGKLHKDLTLMAVGKSYMKMAKGLVPWKHIPDHMKRDLRWLESQGVVINHAGRATIEPAVDLTGRGFGGKAGKYSGWMMANTEMAAQRMSAFMALDMGRSAGLKGDDLIRFVTRMMSDTTGDFTKAMRSGWLQGGGRGLQSDGMSLAGTFQTYIQKMVLGTMRGQLKYARQADMLNDPIDKVARHYAPILATLGGVWATAGLHGIPAVMFAVDNIVRLIDDSGGRFTEMYLQYKLDHPVLFKGMLNEFTGQDIGSRMALSLPMGAGTDFGLNVFGVGKSVLDRAERYSTNQNPWELAPGDLKRRMAAWQALDTGEYVSPTAKKRVGVDVSRDQALTSLMSGLAPVEASRERDAVNARYKLMESKNEKITELRVKMINTITSGGMPDISEALKEVRPYTGFDDAASRDMISRWIRTGYANLYSKEGPKVSKNQMAQHDLLLQGILK